jgi:hypothetical protein
MPPAKRYKTCVVQGVADHESSRFITYRTSPPRMTTRQRASRHPGVVSRGSHWLATLLLRARDPVASTNNARMASACRIRQRS